MRPTLAFLFIASVATAQNTSRLSRPVEFWNPDWSPDGKSIAFESTLSGKYSIYLINADGTNLRRLTADTANNEQPRWSPDGKRIVFSSDRATGKLDIYVMQADGSGQTRLTTLGGGGWYQSSFSPDGKLIAFQGRSDNREIRDRVMVMRADGTDLRVLSDTAFGGEGPRWSRDGKSVEYRRVPYAKRLWDEMGPEDMQAARAGERIVSVPATGGREAVIADRPKGDGRRPSPDGRLAALTKSVDGWAGLYVVDVAKNVERLLLGGPGAGPLGYLRTATIAPLVDTIDTFESPRSGGAVTRGNGAYVIRSVRRIGAARFETADTWFDSTGKETAKQSLRTLSGSLATELEFTRALTDSASMSYTRDRVTGWVQPGRGAPQLFDAPSTGERYAGVFVISAIATSKPANGALFVAPAGAMYGGNPVATRVDSIRVVRRDTLQAGARALPVVVLARGTSEYWVDETTGAEILSKGNAGPEKFWWHIRRGVRPPTR